MDVTDSRSNLAGTQAIADVPATTEAPTVDWNGTYRLAPDIRVLTRGAGTVQVGLEPPRSVLVHDAPPGAVEVLRALDGHASLAATVRSGGGPQESWLPMLNGLVRLGLVVPGTPTVTPPPHLVSVRAALVHRHGSDLADRLLPRRSDAMVVVAGAGEVGAMTAELLAASGVGEVHLRPPRRGRRGSRSLVRSDDPAPQLPPAIVVLTDENARNRVMTAGLTVDLIPHLAVSAGVARAVVGPLVLPGRSACLTCLDRIRKDLDPDWSAVTDTTRTDDPRPSPLLVAAAAMLAAEQALDHLDGVERPRAVDATLEWSAGTQAARRRSWYQHPDCGCQEITH